MTKAGYKRAVAVVAAAVLAVPLVAAFPVRGASDDGKVVGYTVGNPYIAPDAHPPWHGGKSKTGFLSSVDLTTGETTVIGQTGHTDITGLTFGPDGTLYAVEGSTLLRIDPSNAVTTPIGPVAGSGSALTFDCAGRLWMAGFSLARPRLFELDPNTGATLSSVALEERVHGLAVRRNIIFGLDDKDWDNVMALVTINPTTGQLTTIGELEGFDDHTLAWGLAVDREGKLWAHHRDLWWEQGSVFAVDPFTAEMSTPRPVAQHGESLAIPGGAACSTPLERDYDEDVMAFGDVGFYGSTADVDVVDSHPLVDMAATRSDRGYWLVDSGGEVFAFGDAADHGSASQMTHEGIVAIATTLTDSGYWLVASDGAVFSFGRAGSYGSTDEIDLKEPIVDMARTSSGRGYWLVASDGGVFAFGDARFHGSTGHIDLKEPIVGMSTTPSGDGYWLVASDGGVFAFGDAAFHGSTGHLELEQPITGMAPHPEGDGYWLAAADGGVFAFDVGFFGSAAGADHGKTVVSIAAGRTGEGYWLAAT